MLQPWGTSLAAGAGRAHSLTIRFTMIILGPSVLLMVKMCISRRQNMMKSRERMTRPEYSSPGMSLPKVDQCPSARCSRSRPPAARPPAQAHMWPWRPLDPKVLKMGYELTGQSLQGDVFSRNVRKPSPGQGGEAMQTSWEAAWLVLLASWRKGRWRGCTWPRWAAERPGVTAGVPAGALGCRYAAT